jgi:glutamine amidotransferase
VKVTDSARVLDSCAALVLPGVGAFADAMQALRRLKLLGLLKRTHAQGKPFLGVCLGQQLMYERGTEFGRHEGLGIFEGSVDRFAKGLKVPHMGWNQVKFKKGFPLAEGLQGTPEFYFVHSYRGRTPRRADAAGSTRYGGETFDSALWKGNTFATQFHPEKSQKSGLKLYSNFWKIAKKG